MVDNNNEMTGMFVGNYLVFNLPGQSWTQTLPAAKNKLKLLYLTGISNKE